MTAEIIKDLNDKFRKTGIGGLIVITRGINQLTSLDKGEISRKVCNFKAFNNGNDPYHEHDFGAFCHNHNRIFWKIDYYADKEMNSGSENPANEKETYRVLTIMLASEY